MRMVSHLALCALLAAAVVGCSKDSSSPAGKPSGKLSDSEASLFQYVPASAKVVFGGNYEKFLKHWDSSPLKKLSELAAQMTGDENAMRDYMTCWVSTAGNSRLAGAMTLDGDGFAMTMVFDQISRDTFETCAKQGGYAVKADDDGKYLELQGVPDGRGGTTSAGYYFVAKDTAYFAMEMNLTGAPKLLGRQQLEAKLERAKAASAADSAELQQLMAKADRSKSFWFAGTAAGTPAAEVMSTGHGWMELSADALSFGFSVDLARAELASQAVKAYEELASQVGSLPPQLKKPLGQILENSTLTASGKTLQGKLTVTNAVIEELLPTMQALGGGF